jgi:hypothetical protein
MRNARRQLVVFSTGLWLLASGFSCIFAGCSSTPPTTQPTTRPLTMRERQDAAMRDPFGYSPNKEPADISGGGLTDFDKDGFNKDMKNVLSP